MQHVTTSYELVIDGSLFGYPRNERSWCLREDVDPSGQLEQRHLHLCHQRRGGGQWQPRRRLQSDHVNRPDTRGRRSRTGTLRRSAATDLRWNGQSYLPIVELTMKYGIDFHFSPFFGPLVCLAVALGPLSCLAAALGSLACLAAALGSLAFLSAAHCTLAWLT